MSADTSSYTICSAPNVYMFVYILIETRKAPLSTCAKMSLRMSSRLIYDSVWTVSLTSHKTLERVAQNNNYCLKDSKYKSDVAM